MREVELFAKNEELSLQRIIGFNLMQRSNVYERRKLELLKKQDQRTDD